MERKRKIDIGSNSSYSKKSKVDDPQETNISKENTNMNSKSKALQALHSPVNPLTNFPYSKNYQDILKIRPINTAKTHPPIKPDQVLFGLT